MGRGRAKAKQTKVARELKYHSPKTDLAALQRELSGKSRSDSRVNDEGEYPDYEAGYEDYEDDAIDEREESSDDGSWAARRR